MKSQTLLLIFVCIIFFQCKTKKSVEDYKNNNSCGINIIVNESRNTKKIRLTKAQISNI